MTIKDRWKLNPDIDYLNHGSFGATPAGILEVQREFQDALERDPIRFLAVERELEPKLDRVRRVLAALVGAPEADLAFVRSATDGVNAVLRSMPLAAGDEIVLTDHGYNACSNATRFAAGRCGANVRVAKVPFPVRHSDEVLRAIESEYSTHTRLLLIDHVTSPTGLVFPVQQIIESAHARGIRVMIDGAHAPGMLVLDLGRLNPDYYTANHHKWLCAPKASGFLYVQPQWQDEVRPTVISYAANRPRPGRSRFLAEFDWAGTFDPTPLLTVPAAIEWLGGCCPGGIDGLMAANRGLALEARALLCDALRIDPPAPEDMIGSLVALPLPPAPGKSAAVPLAGSPDPLQARLYDHYRIEVPVFPGPVPGSRLLRISLQAYNDITQIERLANALRHELEHERESGHVLS